MFHQNSKHQRIRPWFTTIWKLISSSNFSTITIFLAASFFAYDIFSDATVEADRDVHFYLELVVFVMIIAHLVVEARKLLRMSTELDREKTRNANLSGSLQCYINEQFIQWRFSASETEIAWLMLKGFSFKEIAGFRQVKEKTVRQQASIIYTKSKNKNRSEFNSFFYEELIIGIDSQYPSDKV